MGYFQTVFEKLRNYVHLERSIFFSTKLLSHNSGEPAGWQNIINISGSNIANIEYRFPYVDIVPFRKITKEIVDNTTTMPSPLCLMFS